MWLPAELATERVEKQGATLEAASRAASAERWRERQQAEQARAAAQVWTSPARRIETTKNDLLPRATTWEAEEARLEALRVRVASYVEETMVSGGHASPVPSPRRRRHSRQEAVCAGSPYAGRDEGGTEGVVGYFTNALAIYFDILGALSGR